MRTNKTEDQLKQEYERYATIIKYYETNFMRTVPLRNRKYLEDVINEQDKLFDIYLKMKKGKDFQQSLKNKNASKTRINK